MLRAWAPLLIIVAGITAYHNSFHGVFLLDDVKQIVNRAQADDFSTPWNVLRDSHRPLVDLTLALNHALGNLDTRGYHAWNLLVHLLGGLTLYGVVRRTLELRRSSEISQVANGLATVVALIWVVHPLQTQSVTYTIQRYESMMGLFYLLTVYCFIRGVGSERPARWYVGAITSCMLGAGCKEVIVSAPLTVLLYDRVFIAPSFAELLRRRWGLYAGFLLPVVVLLATGVVDVVRPDPGPSAAVGFGLQGITPLEYGLTQAGVIVQYLKLSLWPHPLCLDYHWPFARTPAQVAGPLVVVLGLLGATLWALVRKPWLGFLGAWFFVILAPTSSIVPIEDPIFEHRMYLPLAAVIVLAVLAAYQAIRALMTRGYLDPAKARLAATGAAAVVVASLTFATIDRNRDYHSVIGMWSDVVASQPDNARAYNNLGNGYRNTQQVDRAIDAYRAAIRIDPDEFEPHANLASSLWVLGRLDEAIEEFRAALRIKPDDPDAYYYLGQVYRAAGRIHEAQEAFRQVQRIRGTFPETLKRGQLSPPSSSDSERSDFQ